MKLVSDCPLHIYAGVLVDDSGLGPLYSFGGSASFCIKDAIVRSLSEALVVRQAVKPWYLEWDGVMNAKGRLGYWSQIGRRGAIDFLFDGTNVKPNHTPPPTTLEQIEILRTWCEASGNEMYLTRLSDAELEDVGYHVVKAFSPNLHPMHLDEAVPYFYSKRLRDVPKKLHLKPAEHLNYEPHPFP